MSISEIGAKSGKPDKVVGMHFFTPIVVLQLIEVIKGKETSEKTMELTSTLGKSLPALRGKRVIAMIEKESPGFIVNRLTIAGSMYLNWLLDYAYDNKIPFESIDADVGALGKFGPCAKWDYLGLDTIYNSFKYFEQVLSSDFAPGKVLTMLVKENNLGKKTGKGICEWTDEGTLVDKDVKKANLFDSELFMALQLNEGCRLLEEGIVSNYKIIDDAMLAGMTIPGPFGPGKRNYKKWCELLNNFADKSGKEYFRPCALMKSGDVLKMRK
jgi:3-hydroxyacyl-CoA dehydrogenase